MQRKQRYIGFAVALLLTVLCGCQRQQNEKPSDAVTESTATVSTQAETTAYGDTKRLPADKATQNAAVTVAGAINAAAVLPDEKTEQTGKATTEGHKTSVASTTRTVTEKPSKITATTERTKEPTSVPTTSGDLDRNKDGWVDGWYRPTTSKGGLEQ